MVERRSLESRRISLMERLGGPPGRFAVLSVVLGLFWFPVRLYLDQGEPIAQSVALSGLYGGLWALLVPAIAWVDRKAQNRPAGTEPDDPAWVRRGAIIGLAVGVPFYGALLVFCLVTGLSLAYPVLMGTILAAIVAIAVTRL
ncbi:hypothetical protein [Actinoplanes aureus]|uniref:Uncharacterized protein n=1 Tax=Actinoplanes aureus TaxID=2792083 RepID=A0A931CG15_9ACTN|nr:hypothetical protein [Actinoplanes aureus]MBG0565841.1 hypothetical protein [Actinoplanes aureus]